MLRINTIFLPWFYVCKTAPTEILYTLLKELPIKKKRDGLSEVKKRQRRRKPTPRVKPAKPATMILSKGNKSKLRKLLNTEKPEEKIKVRARVEGRARQDIYRYWR